MMAAPRTAQKYTPVYPWPGMWGTSAASRRDQGVVSVGVEGEGEAAMAAAATATVAAAEAAAAMEAAAEAAGGKVITHVYVSCKPGTEEDFVAASLANAVSSVLEPDNLRFDILRNVDDPTKFVLVEAGALQSFPKPLFAQLQHF